jgi:hypothetical protein
MAKKQLQQWQLLLSVSKLQIQVHIFNVDFLTNKLFYKKGLKKIGAAN